MSGLVLSRRVGETVLIGSDVRVTVVRMGGGQVGLHIDAPREVPVHRQEVLLRIAAAKETPPCPPRAP